MSDNLGMQTVEQPGLLHQIDCVFKSRVREGNVREDYTTKHRDDTARDELIEFGGLAKHFSGISQIIGKAIQERVTKFPNLTQSRSRQEQTLGSMLTFHSADLVVQGRESGFEAVR